MAAEPDRPAGQDSPPRGLPHDWHRGFWELITVFLIILAWLAMELEFYSATAIAGTSIATATLALVRKG